MKEIVINRMFSGKYLRENIGHEVINLFQADNGKFYIYLNDVGVIGTEHFENGECTIDSMLLAHTLEGTNTVEIIGLASGLHPVYNPELEDKEQEAFQRKYAEVNAISYGGVSICGVNSIFRGSEQQTVNITFEADVVKKVANGKRIYIRMADKTNQVCKELETYETDIVVNLSEVKLGQGLKSYIAEGDADYSVLDGIINDSSLWGDSMPQATPAAAPSELSYMDICQRSYDELAYSNAMAYFAKKYPEIAFKLLDQLTGVKDSYHRDFVVRREENHIDLLFFNSGHLVIVENKIKSELNGVEKDDNGAIVKTQLDDYYDAAKEIKEKYKINCPKPYFFVFAPDYSSLKHYSLAHPNPFTKHLRIGEHFDLVLYSEIYNFLLPYLKKAPYSKDALFVQFVKSLERHTHSYDDGLWDMTVRKFFERIETCNATKKSKTIL